MNLYFTAAGLLAIFTGIVHSALGEVLIFRRLRPGGLIPTDGGQLLQERHVRIIWASWHTLSVFGWAMAAILIWLSLPSSSAIPRAAITQAITVAMLTGSLLVAFGTRARHPGWVGLLGVAILVWLGSAA